MHTTSQKIGCVFIAIESPVLFSTIEYDNNNTQILNELKPITIQNSRTLQIIDILVAPTPLAPHTCPR